MGLIERRRMRPRPRRVEDRSSQPVRRRGLTTGPEWCCHSGARPACQRSLPKQIETLHRGVGDVVVRQPEFANTLAAIRVEA